jgi:RluA family pseudouridine synthase
VAKPRIIELPDGTRIPIVYEDRSVMAIDKPAGWMLVPYDLDKTNRNLHRAISSSILARDFWARSRELKYLRHVHRLDADTSGVLLLAKSPGALHTFSRLFESRKMEKRYLAVVERVPSEKCWTCRLKIAPDTRQIGRMKLDARYGKEAETHFRVLQVAGQTSLVEAQPITGRTHQIRIHLAAAGCPVVGDTLYGPAHDPTARRELALRAIALAYDDPFTKRAIRIEVPVDGWIRRYGFERSHTTEPLRTT